MSKSSREIIRSICVLTIALAGLVHLIIAPAHYAHAPAHGIFFAIAGLIQCAWAVAFWRRSSLALYRVGLAVSGGLVVLWLLTLALPAPFGGHDAGSIDTPALVCKVSELVGLIALVALVMQGGQWAISGKLSAPRLLGEAVIVSLLVGAVFFGAGKAAEPLFPQWQHGVEHAHEETDSPAEHGEHDHAAEHAHDQTSDGEHDHAAEHGEHDH
ncbi:MAG: hypothetical protein Fur0044_38050 [Anaerolineae bacterium]|nr:hypothetical protein [Anaerolineales bacterium]MCQ3974471.1 hypothetical protein [Anaerolineae bacterium]